METVATPMGTEVLDHLVSGCEWEYRDLVAQRHLLNRRNLYDRTVLENDALDLLARMDVGDRDTDAVVRGM